MDKVVQLMDNYSGKPASPITDMKTVFDENNNPLPNVLSVLEKNINKNIDTTKKSASAELKKTKNELQTNITKISGVINTFHKKGSFTFGVGIYHENGEVYTLEEWVENEFLPEQGVAVAVRNIDTAFLVGKKELGGYHQDLDGWNKDYSAFGGYGTQVSDCFTTTDSDSARTDFNGYNNSEAIREQITFPDDYFDVEPYNAPALCYGEMFGNMHGYMGSVGQWLVVYELFDPINEALKLIGGDQLKKEWYWTSTQYSSWGQWLIFLDDGLIYFDSKYNNRRVRAFSAFPNLFTTLSLYPLRNDGADFGGGEVEFNGKEYVFDDGVESIESIVQVGKTYPIRFTEGGNGDVHIGEVAIESNDDHYVEVILHPDNSKFRGIGITNINGRAYTEAEWDAQGISIDNAVGVAVGTDFAQFNICKTEIGGFYGGSWDSDYSYFGGFGTLVKGCTTTENSGLAKCDFNGLKNTDAICKEITKPDEYFTEEPYSAPALCRQYEVGDWAEPKGYMGSLGEWLIVYKNKAEINRLMSKIGGTQLDNQWYWTSTQYSSWRQWLIRLNDGRIDYRFKDNDYRVRAFSAL